MTDIALLFGRDPLSLSREDISAIVTEMRKRRASFNLGNMTAGKVKPKTEKEKATEALASKLNIGGLDL